MKREAMVMGPETREKEFGGRGAHVLRWKNCLLVCTRIEGPYTNGRIVYYKTYNEAPYIAYVGQHNIRSDFDFRPNRILSFTIHRNVLLVLGNPLEKAEVLTLDLEQLMHDPPALPSISSRRPLEKVSSFYSNDEFLFAQRNIPEERVSLVVSDYEAHDFGSSILDIAATYGGYRAFGDSIAFDAPNLIIGARHDDTMGHHAGAVYIYAIDFASRQAKFVTTLASNSYFKIASEFGDNVALCGDYMIVSAPRERPYSDAISVGAVHIYQRRGSADAWNYFDSISPPIAWGNEHGFARSICALGKNLLVSQLSGVEGHEPIRGGLFLVDVDPRSATFKGKLSTYILEASRPPDVFGIGWFALPGRTIVPISETLVACILRYIRSATMETWGVHVLRV